MTSKQGAYLRGLSVNEDTILQLGKDGVSESFVASVETAIAAREIVKVRVLETAPVTVREAADHLASRTGSEVVSCIGSTAVLYRRSDDNVLGL